MWARRQVGQYIVQLGTLGHLYNAVNEILEIVVAASNMADNLGIKEYSLVIEPSRAYITPEQLPEVVPPLPRSSPLEPLREPTAQINNFNCPDTTPDLVKFCIKGVEIAYYLGKR
ncbi:MAG: hypothetical protein TU35_000745 [Thermoproteus sp. AZ2]|uniref:Uncharacterized protein n=1 Tax=Thermoproteus sp. AZ2 TaxID=1609232 RepID=A0ACC6UYG2_9CREN